MVGRSSSQVGRARTGTMTQECPHSRTMESYLAEETLWASGLAARLRLVQANFADDQPATRQNFLAEEVERALKAVVPSRRRGYLQALAEQFPAWQAASPAPADEAPPPAAELTHEALLERLLALAPELSPETRADFGKRLQQAGLSVKEPASVFLDLPPEAQKKLGLAAGQPLNGERVVKLLLALSDLVMALDQLVWALWKQMAPRSNIRKESDFAKMAGPYLGGDPETSTQQLTQCLERTRRLIAALLGAVGRAGASYGRKYTSRFAPDVIEDLAKMEKKWNESLEYVSWRKYRELSKEHASEPAIENEIQECIAKAAENLIIGRAAS